MTAVFGSTKEFENPMLLWMTLNPLFFTNKSSVPTWMIYRKVVTRVYHDLPVSPDFKRMIVTLIS